MTTERRLVEFWEIVQACLVDIYGMTEEKAAKSVQRLWSRGTNGTRVPPSLRSMVYHAAPIHVAMNIAGDGILSDALWEQYERVLKRHGFYLDSARPKVAGAGHTGVVKSVRRVKRAVPEKVYAGR